MIAAILQSTIIMALCLCAVRMLCRQSAALRHAILTAGFVSSLAVPFLNRAVPALEFKPANKLQGFVQNAEILWILDETQSSVHAPAAAQAAAVPALADLLMWIWQAGMAMAGILLVATASRIGLLRLRSRAVASGTWLSALTTLSRPLHLQRRVRLLEHNGTVLGTWGMLRPIIFLPRDTSAWSPARIRAVLTHELAHIKRLDWPVQMLADIARGVYWFNPLFWIAYRLLKTESEHACDDVVLNTGIDARDYAGHLLDLARALKNSDRDWSPILAMSRQPSLERRFIAMLNASLNHRSLSRASALVVCLVAIVVTVPLAAMRAPEQAIEPVTVPLPEVRPPVSQPIASVIVAPPVVRKPAAAKPAPPQGRADGSLAGVVSDPSGALVPGVAVTVRSTTLPKLIEMQTITGEVGQYDFRGLAPDTYVLTASLPGFTTARVGGVPIQSSQTTQRNITLLLGAISQRVEVQIAGSPKPAAPAGTPGRVRIGGLVSAANLISQVKPVYPQSARDAGEEGTVRLQAIIDTEGNLVGLQPVSNVSSALTNAAVVAVRQWRYRPAMLNGEPMQVQTMIEVDFKIAQ